MKQWRVVAFDGRSGVAPGILRAWTSEARTSTNLMKIFKHTLQRHSSCSLYSTFS